MKIKNYLLILFMFFIFITLPRLALADWDQLPGGATDIGIGGNHAWVIGSDSVPGGYGIHHYDADQRWKTIQGGAVAIAVDSRGNPWVVNAQGAIFRYQGGWQELPGSATDIGIGGDSVWVLGSDPVPGGYSIHHWNGSGWDRIEGGAKRITVDPQGNPWIANVKGEIFRLEHGYWQRLPGLATDIAVGADGSAWVIGIGDVPGGRGIHRWTGSNWQDVKGGAMRIAVDGYGNPWVVNIDGGIFKYRPDNFSKHHHHHHNKIRLGGNVVGVELNL